MIPVSLCTTFLPDIPVLRAEIPAMAVTENVTYQLKMTSYHWQGETVS
jgi:hypothetical protein